MKIYENLKKYNIGKFKEIYENLNFKKFLLT